MVYSAQRRSYGPRNSIPLAALRLAREPRSRSASDVDVFTASALVVLSSATSQLCSSIADVGIERVPGVGGRVERWAELRDDFVLDLPRAFSRVPGQQEVLALPRRQPLVLSCVEHYVLAAEERVQSERLHQQRGEDE